MTESTVDQFMARVCDDPAAQARLAVPIATDDYAAVAVDIARDYGLTIAPGDLDDRLHGDPLGLGLLGTPPIEPGTWPGRDWLPTRSAQGTAPPAFDWAWFGDAPLTEPFYEDSVRRAWALPFNRMFRTRTSLATLVGDAANHDAVEPAGFIFHMSRCGSTLAARMLMAVPGHAVASEPEPLDAVVQWATVSGSPRHEQIAAMRAMVAALGRDRIPGQRRFFVKLDAWHTMALPLFRAAFPDVPWLFLYRDPVEVMVSQMAMPGIHLVPGMLPPALLGADFSGATSPVDYGARVLARICDAVLDHWPLGGGMLVEYRDIRTAMEQIVPAHFGFHPGAEGRAAMVAGAAANAKYPAESFIPDAARKRETASDAVRAAVAAHLAKPIADLDALRRRKL